MNHFQKKVLLANVASSTQWPQQETQVANYKLKSQELQKCQNDKFQQNQL